MGSEARTSNGNGGGPNLRSRMKHYLYSGDKNHVMVGIAVFTVAFGIPWYFINRGAKHRSHQDYMEKADRARSERLSSGSPVK